MRAWQVDIDISGINPIIKQMSITDRTVKSACEYALKRMRNPLIKEIKRLVCQRYNISEKTVARKMTQNVYASTQQLAIFISGKQLNPMSFIGTTPNKPQIIERDTSQKKRHVNIDGAFVSIYPAKPYKVDVEIIRGRRKTLALEDGRNPFVMKTGANSALEMPFFIAQNRGKKVKGVSTISIPQMISNVNVRPQIEQFGKELFMEQFNSYIKIAQAKR